MELEKNTEFEYYITVKSFGKEKAKNGLNLMDRGTQFFEGL